MRRRSLREQEIFTPEEVCQWLQCTERQLRQWTLGGQIRGCYVGRIRLYRRCDVERFQDRHDDRQTGGAA